MIKQVLGNKFLAELVGNGRIYLWQNVNGVFREVGYFPTEYSIDAEMNRELIRILESYPNFLESLDRQFKIIPDDFGEVLYLLIKILEHVKALSEKLRFLEQVQVFSLLEGYEFKELKSRLERYYLAKKVEKQ